MKTLDGYILRNFLISCVTVFVVFMALRVIGDLFVNMDEFVKGDRDFGGILSQVGRYYGYQSLLYITELGGVAITLAAAFTLAKMNHTNELTAVLASGMSLHRVVLPILVCSLGLNALIIADTELVLPRIAEQLAMDRGEDLSEETFQIRLVRDGEGSIWLAHVYLASERKMINPVKVLRNDEGELVGRVVAPEAVAGAWKGRTGWYAEEGNIIGAGFDLASWPSSQSARRVYTVVGPDEILQARRRLEAGSPRAASALRDPAYNMQVKAERIQPQRDEQGRLVGGRLKAAKFLFYAPPDEDAQDAQRHLLAVILADEAEWVPSRGRPRDAHWRLEGGRVFMPTDLTPEELLLRQSSRWLEFTSSARLTELLDKDLVPNRRAALLARHLRFTDPINRIVMLLLPLPFILSRERNVKASVGLCVLVVGVFYASIYMMRYVQIEPIWSAWLPTLVFGPVAAMMLDSIKT